MPLFPPNQSVPLSAVQLDNASTLVRLQARNSFRQMLTISNMMVQLVWMDSTFSPQQIINSLSGVAVSQLTYAQNLRSYLLSVIASEGIALSSITFLRPISAYSISGSTITVIPSAYSGP